MAKVCPKTGTKVVYLTCLECEDKGSCKKENKSETRALFDIISEWKREASIFVDEDTTCFYVNDNTVYIITSRPGLYIGKHGELYNKYQAVFHDNGHPSNIRFIDTFYKNVVELKFE